MTTDRYSAAAQSLIAPSDDFFAITPDDVAVLPRATKAIYVGTGGDVTVVSVRGDSPVTFAGVPDGAVLDLRVKAIRATGTTASNLVGLA